MYKMISIHEPVRQVKGNTVAVLLRTSIPEFLLNSRAIDVVNCEISFDSVNGFQTVPLGSLIGYEESNQTISRYNCWFIGRLNDFVKNDGVFYTKPPIIFAMPIPAKEDPRPVWVHSSGLIYNDDGTATLETPQKSETGRVGIDFILTYAMKKDGKPDAHILSRNDDSYKEYIVCNENGEDLGKLCELYPL